jgi:hypothetical protein
MYKYLLFYISIIAVADKLSFFFSSVYFKFQLSLFIGVLIILC